MSEKWLTVVGIQEDGFAALCPQARSAIESAGVLIGGKRHLKLVPIRGRETFEWTANLAGFIRGLTRFRERSPVVIASGDPCEFGIAPIIMKHLGKNAVRVLQAPSCRSLICSRMGWEISTTMLMSFTRSSLSDLARLLEAEARIVLYCTPSVTPEDVSRLLCDYHFGPSEVLLADHIGGDRETVITTTAAGFLAKPSWRTDPSERPLVSMAIRCLRTQERSPTSFFASNEDFVHDGQISRSEMRILAVAKLCTVQHAGPAPVLWDIGSGSGSIAIEWLRHMPGGRAIAFERCPDRAERICQNAHRFAVPMPKVIRGDAPGTFSEVNEIPDAVFVGGGLRSGVHIEAMKFVRSGGLVVAHAVSLEGEAVLQMAHRDFGGNLSRFFQSEANCLSDVRVWRSALPITRWVWHNRKL